jgi:hypothetical protein
LYGDWKIRCNKCYPTAPVLMRLETTMQTYRRGGVMQIHTRDALEKKFFSRRQRTMGTTQDLAVIEQEVKTHLQKFDANLAGSEIEKAISLVQKYRFDPFLHLTVYQGRVTPTIDGLYWWAQTHVEPFEMTSEAIPQEQKDSYGVKGNEIGVITKIFRIGADRPACTGFGRAAKSGPPVMQGSPVEAMHPYRMAEKRAEAQALRKFAAIGGTSDLEIRMAEEEHQEVAEAQARAVPTLSSPVTKDDFGWGPDRQVQSKTAAPERPEQAEPLDATPDEPETPPSPPESAPGAFAGWLERCIDHDITWQLGKYGPFHPNGKVICDHGRVLRSKVESILASLEVSWDEFTVKLKARYGGTWSALTAEQRVDACNSLAEQAERLV